MQGPRIHLEPAAERPQDAAAAAADGLHLQVPMVLTVRPRHLDAAAPAAVGSADPATGAKEGGGGGDDDDDDDDEEFVDAED